MGILRKTLLAAALLAAAAGVLLTALAWPRRHALRFLAGLAAGATGEELPLLEPGRLASFRRCRVGRCAGGGPRPAMVVVHGVTTEGVDDARLLRLAEGLRRAGFVVIVPEVGIFVDAPFAPGDETGLAALLAEVEAGRLDGVDATRIGVLGVSVGGGYAIQGVAARRAAGGGRGVRALLLVGTPDDPRDHLEGWLERPLEAGGEAAEAARFARGVILGLAATRLLDAGEAARLRAWLDASSTRMELPAGALSARGLRLARWGLDGAPLPPEAVWEVGAAVGPLLDAVAPARMAPERLAALRGVACCVIHGVSDPLVPVAAAQALADRLAGVTTVHLLRSRHLGHTEADLAGVATHVALLGTCFDAVRAP